MLVLRTVVWCVEFTLFTPVGTRPSATVNTLKHCLKTCIFAVYPHLPVLPSSAAGSSGSVYFVCVNEYLLTLTLLVDFLSFSYLFSLLMSDVLICWQWFGFSL